MRKELGRSDTRRWLVRKAMADGRTYSLAAPFDSKKASIVGPDTEPLWLAPESMVEAEFDALCEIVDAVVDAVVTRAEMAQWQLEHAVRARLGDEAADAVERITLGWRWAEFERERTAPSPTGTGTEGPPKPKGGAHSV